MRKLLNSRYIGLVVLAVAVPVLIFIFAGERTPKACRAVLSKIDKSLVVPDSDILVMPEVAHDSYKYKLVDSGGREYVFETTVPNQQKVPMDKASQAYGYTPTGLLVAESNGGHLMLSTPNGEELAMLKQPQGIDNKGNRIDFKYEIFGSEIRVIERRIEQAGCASGEVEIFAPVVKIDWNEALVMVGQSPGNDGDLKDGDIITMKPAGWNWGEEEKKRFAIVRVPKIGFRGRAEVNLRTEDGLAAYAIDYTKIASKSQLDAIRDIGKTSPILDASDNAEIIQEKVNVEASIVPERDRLASWPENKTRETNIEKVVASLVRPVHAENLIVRSIGSATGRDYSTITAWESACGGGDNSPDACDLTDTTGDTADIVRGELYADSEFVESVVINGFTTSTTAYPILTAAASDLHDGIEGTGAVVNPLKGGTSGTAIWIQDSNVRVEWLEVTNWTNVASNHHGIRLGDTSTTGIFVDHVIVHDDGHGAQTNSDADGIVCSSRANVSATVTNSFVYNIARQGIGNLSCDDTTINVYNNTVFNCRIEDSSNQYGCIGARSATNPTINAINNIGMDAEGGASDFNDVGNTNFSAGTSNYNISSDGTAFGADIESGTATASTTTTVLIDTSATFTTNGVVAGDWLNNDTRSGSSKIQSVDSETQVTLEEAITSQASGDAYSVNKSAYYRSASNQFKKSSTTLGDDIDLHIKLTSDAYDTGSDQSSNLNDDRDIDRETRPQFGAWDIGADEFKSNEPVGWWKFDEGIANTCAGGTNDACDSSLNQLDGAFSASPPQIVNDDLCITGKCLFFDGGTTDKLVTIDNANPIDFDAGLATGFTAQFWIKVISDGEGDNGRIFQKHGTTFCRTSGQSGNTFLLDCSIDLATTDATLANIALNLNQWYNVALGYTDDGDDEITIWIDGRAVGTSTNGVGSPSADTTNWLIGNAGTSTREFHGFVDDFRVYNFERTAAEIRASAIIGSAGEGSGAVLGSNSLNFLSDGLVGYWKMDEGALNTCTGGSNDVCDSSGNGSDGTENGTMTSTDWISAKFGPGLDFDGSNDYINITNFSAKIVNAPGFSMAGWVRPETASVHDYLFGIRNDSNADFYVLRLSGGNSLECRFRNSSGTTFDASPQPTITEDVWQHVAFTYDGSTVRCFINGQAQGTAAASGTITNVGVDMFMAGNTTNFLNGDLDEVRFYNRGLSPAEVSLLYNFAPGPVLNWSLDENTGTSIFDRSGNSFNSNGTSGIDELSWVSGRYGSGLTFDGTNDWVECTDAACGGSGNLDFEGTDSFSWAGWVKSTASVSQTLIGKKNSGAASANGWQMKQDNTDIARCRVADGTTQINADSTITINDGEWHHVACTVTASTMKVYVDGVEEGSADVSSVSNSLGNGAEFRLGADGDNGEDFAGELDNATVYNYELSPSQVINDMNAGHPIGGSPVGSQVGYWKMDEGFGDSSNDSTVNGNTADLADTTSTCPTTGGCPTWRNEDQCKSGKCLDFDGTDDTLAVPNSTAIDMDGSLAAGWTFTTWFYPHSDGESDLGRLFVKNGTFCRTDDESAGTVDILCNASLVTTDASFTIPTRVTLNTWNHIALAYTDDTDDEITVWLNGVNQGSSTNGNGSVTADSFKLFMGGNPASNVFDGLLDDFKIYNKELSDSEVLIDMNANSAVNLGTYTREADDLIDGAGDPPVGEWKLDENTGTGSDAVKDTSGNDNHGTTEASMTETDWVPGKHGSALDFDGTDDEVTVTDSSLFNFGNATTDSPFSISAWVNPADASNFNIVSNSTSDTLIEYVLKLSGTDDLQLTLWDDSTSVRERRVSDAALTSHEGEWVHVAATYDGGGGTTASDGINLYVNGGNVSSSTDDAGTYVAMHDESTTVRIGSHTTSSSTYSNGRVDQVKIFDYELSPAQIAYDYNRGAPIAHWKLDDCQGGTAFDSGPFGLNGAISIGDTGTFTSPGTCDSGTSTHAWNAGTTGKRNASLGFDGTNDEVDLGNPSELQGTGSHSVSAWVNPDTLPGTNNSIAIFRKGDDTPSSGWGLALNITDTGGVDEWEARVVTTSPSTVGYGASGGAPVTSQWTHLVNVFDNSAQTVSLFVNGRFVSSTSTGTVLRHANESHIGVNAAGGEYFDGLIDDVRLYNYPLSAAQIRKIMNEGAVRFGPDTGSP